ncbi:unnamed protein product [Ilex paraguariensis]|uniref:Uncharacterized protein n=1 Tax=Ilex paraguariensis TaxID=185542 RepID=A0ABC8UIG6_9AQUA
MDKTKRRTQVTKTQRGEGPDKARAKQRDGSGEGNGGDATECIALGDAIHRVPPRLCMRYSHQQPRAIPEALLQAPASAKVPSSAVKTRYL